MTASVDEFEDEMRGVPVTDVGSVKLPFGNYSGKEVQYREYGGGHVLVDLFSWRIYPEIPATYFETNNSTVQVETKNMYTDCGFKFLETDTTGNDIYARDNFKLFIGKVERETGLGRKIVHYFWLEQD